MALIPPSGTLWPGNTRFCPDAGTSVRPLPPVTCFPGWLIQQGGGA